VWRRAAESLGTVALSIKWSIVLMMYCSRIVASCLQPLTALSACTSCRPCQTSWKLARVCWEHVCLAAKAGLLDFSLCLRPTTHREPRDTWQRRSPTQSGGEVRSHRTHGSVRAHLNREARSRAIGHVAASEPTSAERRDLEP
jgi:hypothetical protein